VGAHRSGLRGGGNLVKFHPTRAPLRRVDYTYHKLIRAERKRGLVKEDSGVRSEGLRSLCLKQRRVWFTVAREEICL